MPLSKLNLALSLALACTLTACANKSDESKNGESANATFIVDPIAADVSDLSTDPHFRGLTNARLFRFHACVKDVAVLQGIASVPFAILDGERQIDRQVTDPSGCFYWNEKIEFSPTEDETYLEISRTLKPESVHQGSVTVNLAVNPWRKDGEAFRDLRVQARPERIRAAGTAQAQSAGSSSLQVSGVSIEVTLKSAVTLDSVMQIAFEPKLVRKAFDGKPIISEIADGSLELTVQLVAMKGNQSEIITAPLTLQPVAIKNGVVRLTHNLPWLRHPSREAILELRFRAKAIHTPSAVLPDQGHLVIGALDGQILSQNGPLQALPGEIFSAPAPDVAGDNGARNANFLIGKVRVERIDVLSLDGIGKPRLIELQMVSCLKNGLSMKPILDESFSLESNDGWKEEKVTESDSGCLIWKTRLNFDYSGGAKPIRTELTITGKSGFYQGASAKRVVYFVPGVLSESSVLLDEQFDGAPTPTVADGRRPELVLTGAAYKFRGRSFEIDSMLNLSTKRRYRLSFSPAIRRMGREGWLSPERITGGKFTVRLLLETTDLDNPVVVDAQELTAEAIAGDVNVDVDFHFANLALVNNRLQLSLEVLPLDRSVNLATVPVSDTIELLGGGSLSLVPRSGQIADRIALAERGKQAPLVNLAEQFAKAFGMQAIAGSAQTAAASYAQGDEKALGELCGLFYPAPNGFWERLTSYHRACLASPQDYLVTARTAHVRKLRQARLQGNPESLGLSMNAGFSVSASESTSAGHSSNTNFNLGGQVPLLSVVGVNIGAGVSYGTSWSQSQSESKTRSRSSSLSRSLDVDVARFEIEADLDRCFTVTTKEDQSKKYFHCSAAPAPEKFTESYYFLHEAPRDSAIQDSAERPFVSLLRGEDRFQSYVKMLQDQNVVLEAMGSPILPLETRAFVPAGAYDGLFPGLVTPK